MVVLVLEDIIVVIEVMIQARKMFPAHHRNVIQKYSAAIAHSSVHYFGNNSSFSCSGSQLCCALALD